MFLNTRGPKIINGCLVLGCPGRFFKKLMTTGQGCSLSMVCGKILIAETSKVAMKIACMNESLSYHGSENIWKYSKECKHSSR